MPMQKWISLAAAAMLGSLCLPAQAELAVVVGANSPTGNMTREQLSDLYLGHTRSLPGGGGAVLLLPQTGPIRDEFETKVLGKTDAQARAVWARLTFTGAGAPPKDVPDANDMKHRLQGDPNAVGVVDRAAVDAQLKVIFLP